ncbi:MAG: hypothetical protein IJP56_02345 [Synergistaceae bacterium]|nr:hypothetical protein [Synergistaceae bacterium]MBQ6909814.1 hypothetical protein [Synergistaceae bacterium]MBR0043661.1 hypothetical protein [Synergistaceae bacterium]MBR0097750.1 hypothetical protein [Synergistaceae bacterium]
MTSNLKSVVVAEVTNFQPQNFLGDELLRSFIDFLDVSPRTARAYNEAIKQLLSYFAINDVRQPVR